MDVRLGIEKKTSYRPLPGQTKIYQGGYFPLTEADFLSKVV